MPPRNIGTLKIRQKMSVCEVLCSHFMFASVQDDKYKFNIIPLATAFQIIVSIVLFSRGLWSASWRQRNSGGKRKYQVLQRAGRVSGESEDTRLMVVRYSDPGRVI